MRATKTALAVCDHIARPADAATCCSPAAGRCPQRDAGVRKQRYREVGRRRGVESTVSSVPVGEADVSVVEGDDGQRVRLSWLLHLR